LDSYTKFQRRATSGASNAPFGAYCAGSRRRAFQVDTAAPMPADAKYSVFAPLPGDGSFRHAATAANPSSPAASSSRCHSFTNRRSRWRISCL